MALKSLEVGLGLNTAAFSAGLSKAAGMFSKWESDQAKKLAHLNAEMKKIGGSVVGGQGFDFLGNKIAGANAQLSKTSYILRGVSTAATGVATVLGGAFGVGISKAMQFESAMAKVAALTVSSTEDLRLYNDQLVRMGKEIGVGPVKLAESLYFVTSAGVTGQKALDAVRLSAMGAKMGMGEASNVARLLATTINVYGESGLTAERSFDLLTQAIKFGSAEASEYASQLGGVMSIGRATGQSLEELYAAVSTYTIAGQTAGQATTALRQLLVGIQTPSRIAADAFKLLAERGFDIKKTLAEQGLHAALMQLKTAVGENAEAYRVLFPSIEAMNMALALGSPMADRYAESLEGMSDAAGKGAEGFEKMEQTAEAQWSKMKAQMEGAFVELGKQAMPLFQSLLPTVTQMTTGVLGLIGAFAKLPQPVQMVLLGTLATVGPVSKLATSFSTMIPVVTELARGAVPLAKEVGLIGLNAKRAADGMLPLKAGGEAAAAAFAGAAGGIKAFALALGTAGLAIGTFMLAYKGMSMAMETGAGKWVAKLGGDIISSMTGLAAYNKWKEQGVAALSDATDSEMAVLNKFKADQAKVVYDIVQSRNLLSAPAGAGVLKQSPMFAPNLTMGGLMAGPMGLGPKPPSPTGAMGAAVAGLGGGGGGGEVDLTKPIALSRDMVKEWRKEGAAAKKTAEEWRESIDKLTGVSAAREMDALRQQVVAIEKSGGAVKNVEALAKQVWELVEAGAEIPKELIPTIIAAQAKESAEATREFAKSLYEAAQAAEDMNLDAVMADMDPMLRALESLGPTTSEVQRDFKGLADALALIGGPSKMTNQALLSMIKQMEDLLDTEKLTTKQMELLGDLYTEALNRRIIPGMEGAKKATFEWEMALQGVALLAGALGGAFGDVLGVVGNIGQQFKGWDTKTGMQRFTAIAGGVGQIGGLIGQKNRKTGGAIQGAAGGAMTGAAMGSIVPGIGTVAGGIIGGIVGGIGGLFGGRKKEKEEKAAKLAAEKEQYEGLIKALERQYGSIMKARNAARLYGIDLKAAMDPKNPKALEAALADLEKRQAGMQTAMGGAASLANWKPTSDAGAKAQGALFGSVFWAAVKTEGLTKAAAALGEPFEEMWKNASASMQTLLAPIRQQLDLAKNESFAAAAEGSNALAELLAGLSDAGVVSIQDLSNASTVAQEQYNQALAAAQEQGLSGAAAQEAAIRAVGPAIAELIALHEQLGIPLDENLQKLKDTAEESGVMFPEDAMTRAAESMERVAAALEKAFGFSTGLANNVDRIGRGRAPDYGGGGNGGGDNYPEYASGTGGPVRVKRDMIARIHAGEGLLVVPKNEMPAGGRLAWGSFERGIRGEESPLDRGTIIERRAGTLASGGTSGSETTTAASVESPTMQVVEALEEVRAALIELAAVQPITVQNAPVIELIDQSAVKTAEGQRAFGQFVTAEVERALDQNSRGLTTKIEQIARRAVSK